MLRSSEREVIESSTTRMPGAIVLTAADSARGTGAAADGLQLAARPAGFRTMQTVPSRSTAPPDTLPVAGVGIPRSPTIASLSARNSSTHTAKRSAPDFNTITYSTSPGGGAWLVGKEWICSKCANPYNGTALPSSFTIGFPSSVCT
jgi:hypothetical protein